MRLRAALWIAMAAASAQDAPVTRYPVVQVEGRVARVALGSGMPALEVEANGARHLVRLGSMRYLMENGFSPKAGVGIRVTGYQVGGEVVAIRVTLVESKKTLELRDEQGWPMWQGCRHRHHHHHE